LNVLWFAFIALALAVLQGWLYRRFGRVGVGYERRFEPACVFAGGGVTMVEVLSNKKPLPLPWLRVESRMSPSLVFGAQDDLEVTGERYHRSVFFLGAYSRVTRRHKVRAAKRGLYAVGSVAMTGGDLFGGGQWTLGVETGASVTVYPRLLDPNEVDPPSSRWQGDVLVKRWIQPDPYLTSGVRPYRAGDAARDVHWAATARLGEVQVKTRDFTADPRALILLNVQAKPGQWGDLMEYEQGAVEYGVSLAATLLLRLLDGGAEAGFAANAPAWGMPEKECVHIPARRSPRQAGELLDALARLRVLRACSFPTFIERLGRPSGMDILLLTCYLDEGIEEKIGSLRRMGNSVTVRVLDMPLPKGDGSHAA